MPTPEEIKKQLLETSTIVENTLKSVAAQIGDIFQDALSEADSITKIFGKDVQKQLNSLARSTDKMVENQLKINQGQASSKDLSKQLLDYKTKEKVLSTRITNLMTQQPELAAQLQSKLNDVAAANADYVEGLKDQLKEVEKIEGAMGNLGSIVKGLNKIPILGNLINSEKVLEKMQKTAANTKNTFAVMGTGILEIGKSIGKGLTDPLTILTFIINAGLKADKQVTTLAKSLVITKDEATGIREQFVTASKAINDVFVTTDKLLESQAKLSDQLGISKIFSMDLNKEFTTLTGKIGLSEEAAGGLAKISIATGKSARQITTNTIANIEKVKQETGLRLNNKKILEATGKVSGQLLANFKGNAPAIAEAIAKAEALGTSLEQTKAQGESLLNFESSIESELKAELITGKQINLEKARMAALMGDQKSVAEELSAQAVDFNTFSNMNVIAQKSLAEALGTSADALSDQLFKQQYLNKSKEEIIALGGEEAAQRMEALSAQDKFNSAVQKLQDILGNLVAGPLGQLIDGFASVASSATAIKIAMGALLGMSITKLITGLAALVIPLVTGAAASATMMSALTLGVGAVAIIASIARISAAMNSAKKETQQVQDGIAPSNKGPFTITDNFGATAITSNGDSLAVSPNINRNDNILNGGASVDLTPMIMAINEVRAAVDRLYSKDQSINMDGKKVGTTLVQGSYKVA